MKRNIHKVFFLFIVAFIIETSCLSPINKRKASLLIKCLRKTHSIPIELVILMQNNSFSNFLNYETLLNYYHLTNEQKNKSKD